MRWFLSLILLALFAVAAACSSQPATPRQTTAPAANAQTIVVHKTPT